MFTGIVEEVGTVASVREAEGARRIRIEAETVMADLQLGASVSIDGACHTVAGLHDGAFSVDSVATTMSRTVSGTYAAGSRVNLERAAKVGSRLDGHLVQGHVDGIGELTHLSEQGEHRLLDFAIPVEVWRQTILHGSITLNGVSLTVSVLEPPNLCQVALIPHTWEHTNFGGLEVGASVNVEGDMIGKYVMRMITPTG